ncbi:MAG: hypothetical protein ACLTR5_08460 [Oscillospiraceae bacterium]
MCIQTIKSVGVKEYASELWTSIKEIDGGKILSSASELLEVNTKAIKEKARVALRREHRFRHPRQALSDQGLLPVAGELHSGPDRLK